MNPQTFARAVVSIEAKYGLRLDAEEVWLRLDEFKKVKGLQGGKCNETKGWYGLKGNCKRGKKGEGEGKGKESKREVANKIRERKGMKPIGESSSTPPKSKSPTQSKKTTTPRVPKEKKNEGKIDPATIKKAEKGDPGATPKDTFKVFTAADLVVPGSGRLDYSKATPKLDALAKSGVTMLMRDRADRPEDVYKLNQPGKAEKAAFEINHFLSPPMKSSVPELNKFRDGGRIKDLDSFESAFRESFKTYDTKTGKQNLTPIYQIRRSLGDRVSRGEFDQFMMGLVRQKKITLTGGSVEDSAIDKIMDSMATSIDRTRTLVKMK